MKLELDGSWALYHFDEGDHDFKTPEDLFKAGLSPVTAEVPGNVELDLVRAGQLPEPFYAGNLRLLRELETHEWWLTRTFTSPADLPDKVDLVFDGVDTLATVWVNDMQVGKIDNMFIQQRMDVSSALRRGVENRLTVCIHSAVNAARKYPYDAASMSWEGREEGLFVRKAAHVWGWDIMPRIVSAGIWKPVWLEPVADTAIEDLYFWTRSLTPQGGAVLGVRFQFRTPERLLRGFALRVRGTCGEHAFETCMPVEFLAGGFNIHVPDARLWWPRGYGDPNLYSITTQLLYHDHVVAERVDEVGIRRLVVDRTELAGKPVTLEPAGSSPSRVDSPPDPESHFVFYVNNVAVMVKGTNWVPLDAFHSRDIQRVQAAVELAEDLNCTMIRCWGGNVYESDRFFELCDQKGIMVWQDFAFACSRYPLDAAFLTRVEEEVAAVVKRLRNHASLAIWCGDNEIDMAYLSDGISPEHNRITRTVIPQVVQRHDPYRAFVPSSPYAPPAVIRQADPWRATPEQHLWGPRGYFKSPFYTQHSAHFIGEMGYHGCPNVSSIDRFISPESRWPWRKDGKTVDEWNLHSTYHWDHSANERDRIKLMANQVREWFGEVPEDIDRFAIASQVTQAEAKKFFVESTRMRKWKTTGVLWWNVIDGWPQFSDAIVDYYFGKKLAYHYIWRAQRGVCLMIGEAGSGKILPLVASNDTNLDQHLTYRVWDAETGITACAGSAQVPANQNWQLDQIRIFNSEQRLFLIQWDLGGQQFGNHYVAGWPPVSLDWYLRMLPKIAALPRSFDPELVGR